jgi:hypothetical protein
MVLHARLDLRAEATAVEELAFEGGESADITPARMRFTSLVG